MHLGLDDEGRELVVHVWPNGANIDRGDERAPIPFDLAPDELTPAVADDLIARGSRRAARARRAIPRPGSRCSCSRVASARSCSSASRRKGSKEKPKRASLLAAMEPSTVTLDEALALLSLPRVVGVDAEGVEITAQNGRYGPYLKKGTDSRSLATEEQMFTVTLDEAEAIFAQPKQRARSHARSRRSPSSARTRSRARRSGCSTAGSARTSPMAP